MNDIIENLETEVAREEDQKGGRRKRTGGRRDDRSDSNRQDRKKNDDKREESQFIEKLISVRRVTKVVKGGKNMRFSALVVVGDGKGRVAYTSAKAREVPDAIKKASTKAKTRLIKVPLKYGRTLHHDVSHYNCSSKVQIRSAKPGTGVIAGGSMRAIFEALGVQDVVAKRIGTGNSYNVVRSTFNALKLMESPRQVSKRRGFTATDINDRRNFLLGKKGEQQNVEQD